MAAVRITTASGPSAWGNPIVSILGCPPCARGIRASCGWRLSSGRTILCDYAVCEARSPRRCAPLVGGYRSLKLCEGGGRASSELRSARTCYLPSVSVKARQRDVLGRRMLQEGCSCVRRTAQSVAGAAGFFYHLVNRCCECSRVGEDTFPRDPKCLELHIHFKDGT